MKFSLCHLKRRRWYNENDITVSISIFHVNFKRFSIGINKTFRPLTWGSGDLFSRLQVLRNRNVHLFAGQKWKIHYIFHKVVMNLIDPFMISTCSSVGSKSQSGDEDFRICAFTVQEGAQSLGNFSGNLPSAPNGEHLDFFT